MDEQTQAVLEEIIQFSGLAPPRQPGDFTAPECAAMIGRSDPTVRRVLQQQVEAGMLASEQRFDPVTRRVVRVWWKVDRDDKDSELDEFGEDGDNDEDAGA